jgi:hypothetical protein
VSVPVAGAKLGISEAVRAATEVPVAAAASAEKRQITRSAPAKTFRIIIPVSAPRTLSDEVIFHRKIIKKHRF